MEELMDDVIQLDGSIAVKEASDSVKPIADKEIKNSLYYHLLATEGVWKYLNDNDIVNCEPVNLRSCSKFLSEFEYTDIQLPNLSVCVRAVYDEEILFVPKSHFEAKITPDVYVFVKVDDELKTGKVLGFVRPDEINKKNDNGKYYFVNRSFLKSFSELIELIKNSSIKEQYLISDKAEDTLEKIIVQYFDNDIDKTKKNKLFDYLKNSSIAREKLIEFGNYERLSYMALNEFKDLDVEDNDFSKYLRTLFPKDEFSSFNENKDFEYEKDTETSGGLYIDDDLVKNNETNSLDSAPVADEFEIFENSGDELSSISSDEHFDENEFTNKSISEIPIDANEDVLVAEDLEFNVLDDINDQSKGLDTDTVIGLTEDVMLETEENKREIDVPEGVSEEKELNESEVITDEIVDNAVDEATSQETEEINESIDAPEPLENVQQEEMAENSDNYQKIFDDADSDTNLSYDENNINTTPTEQSSEMPELVHYENEDDVGMIKVSNDNPEIVNNENTDLNEIYSENAESNELETVLTDSQEITDSSNADEDFNGTDFKFATDKGFKLSKKIAVAVSAGVLIFCLAGIGAWHFLSNGKSNDNQADNTDNNMGNTEVSDFSFDLTDGGMTADNQQIATDTSDNVAANIKLPAQLPSSDNTDGSSEQITIQKIKKDFSKPDTYVSVSKIVWDIPEYMTYNDSFSSYLQTVGSSLKVNLSSDLLLINESPILNSVKLRVSLQNNGKSFSADVIQGCGTKSIDDLVLQSVKQTMNTLKPPINNFETADEDLYLTICL